MTTETPIEIEPKDWQDILGYIRALEERVMKLEAQHVEIQYGAPHNTNEECQTRQCSYYTHYLVYGGPDLIHEAFHQAEKQCDYWQSISNQWFIDHEHDNARYPDHLERQCRHWEERIRA